MKQLFPLFLTIVLFAVSCGSETKRKAEPDPLVSAIVKDDSGHLRGIHIGQDIASVKAMEDPNALELEKEDQLSYSYLLPNTDSALTMSFTNLTRTAFLRSTWT